jgi:hypothetical protein
MPRAANGDRVVVMLNGSTERLVLDSLAALAQDYPRRIGPAVERVIGKWSLRLQPWATSNLMSAFGALVAEIVASGRLPRIRQGRGRPASRDELFLVALIGAVQRGNKGRAIEAAIALLDTGDVNRVIEAAKILGTRLAENGLVLTRVATETFDHVAGYPAVEDAGSADSKSSTAPASGSSRPTLHLLESA